MEEKKLTQSMDAPKQDGNNNMLHMAILESPDDIQKIDQLLASWSWLATECNMYNDTPLHLAVQTQRLAVVDRLLQVDTSALYKYSDDGNIPLHMAVKNRDIAIVKRLLLADNGTMLDYRCHGASVLHFARDACIASYLLTCKPSLIDAVDDKHNTPLHYLSLLQLDQRVSLFHLDQDSSLSQLDREYLIQTAEILIRKKPSIMQIQNCNGSLALEFASIFHRDTGLVALFFHLDPDLQYYDSGKDHRDNTALHLLASCTALGDTNLVRYMAKSRQMELDVRNRNDDTPMDTAINRNNTRVVELFRFYVAIDCCIASYQKFDKYTRNVHTYIHDQCALSYVLPPVLGDIVLLYLGATIHTNKRKHE